MSPRWLAVISIAGQVGPIIGPTLGGWFVESFTWHWIFLINVPIGAVGLFAVHRFLPKDAIAEAAPFDFFGCGLLSLCMVAFSMALDSPAHTHKLLVSGGLFVVSAIAALESRRSFTFRMPDAGAIRSSSCPCSASRTSAWA